MNCKRAILPPWCELSDGDDIDLFAAVSGDVNPAHLDATFATQPTSSGHVVAHGMWTGALISAVLGTKLPGPGTIYLAQDFRFLKPVVPGDTVTAYCNSQRKALRETDRAFRYNLHQSEWRCGAERDSDCHRPRSNDRMAAHDDCPMCHPASRALRILHKDRKRNSPPIRAAIVHPCSPEAILGAIEVRDEGLLEPILIGPEAKIRAAADAA